MQLITAVLRPASVVAVVEAVQELRFQGLTVIEASGFGKLQGHVEIYRGARSASEFQHQGIVEIVARDEDVRDLIDVICKAAATGRLGDGKIWVTPVGELIRIRTREVGVDAL
jgi:nitrogen regulatory protein P-II 1